MPMLRSSESRFSGGGGGPLDFHARVFSGGGEGFLEGSVAGDAPGEGDEGVAVFLRGVDCFFDEGVEDGFLERGADVGEVGLGFFDLLELVEEHRFMIKNSPPESKRRAAKRV